MSKRTLDELKAAFAPQSNNNNNEEYTARDFYRFWKMNIDEQATVRFLPDLDAENPRGFLTENITHNLTINGQWKKVPCLEMYGEPCPACQLAQKYYAEGNDEMGKKFYKKREYLGQIIVKESPIEVSETPLVKLVALGPKIYKLIQSAFSSGDLEEAPYEFVGGYDFRIVKSEQGDYADYSLSKFVPKQSDVDVELLEQISTELYDLGEQRTKHITAEAMEALLVAAQTGSVVEETNNQTTEVSSVNVAPGITTEKTDNVVQESSPPQTSATSTTSTTSNKVEDVLAKIRLKAEAKKAEAEKLNSQA